MTAKQLEKLHALIDIGQEDRFYSWKAWKRLSLVVRTKIDRNECTRCKARGKYTPAAVVHHVKHLRDRPDLALSIYDPDTGERQLESLCRACHEAMHPERLAPAWTPKAQVLTEERWD